MPRRSLGTLARTPLLLLTLASLAGTPAVHSASLAGWGASVGQFDLAQEEKALELGVDYRFRPVFWGIEPILGLGATSDEAVFGYVGIARPFDLGGSRFTLVPNFAVSLFENGDGKDLGQALEFRSGLELFYQLGARDARGPRIGLGFYHLSNASMDDVNPGANSLLLRVVLPHK